MICWFRCWFHVGLSISVCFICNPLESMIWRNATRKRICWKRQRMKLRHLSLRPRTDLGRRTTSCARKKRRELPSPKSWWQLLIGWTNRMSRLQERFVCLFVKLFGWLMTASDWSNEQDESTPRKICLLSWLDVNFAKGKRLNAGSCYNFYMCLGFEIF